MDKVLIYDGDDGERKIYRRRKQAGCWTVKTTVVKKSYKGTFNRCVLLIDIKDVSASEGSVQNSKLQIFGFKSDY